MAKVQLKENIQYFDHDDSDFYIQGKEIKDLAIKHLRSYSIKLFLFSGRLKVLEGEFLFMYKSAKIFIDKDGLYGKEAGRYFTKDFEFDVMIFIDEEKVPKHAFNKLNGIEEKPKVEPKVEPKLRKLKLKQ